MKGKDAMHILVRWFTVPKKLPNFTRDHANTTSKSYKPKYMPFPKWLQHRNLEKHLKKKTKDLTDDDYWNNWKIESLPKTEILNLEFPMVVQKGEIHKVNDVKVSSSFFVDVLLANTQ